MDFIENRVGDPDGYMLSDRIGYEFIDNYPPYDKLEGAICLAKVITSEG